MNLWLIVASCGDYYCEDDHVIAVATIRESAEALAREAENQFSVYLRRGGKVDRYARWNDIRIEQTDADVIRKEAQGTVTDQRDALP